MAGPISTELWQLANVNTYAIFILEKRIIKVILVKFHASKLSGSYLKIQIK